VISAADTARLRMEPLCPCLVSVAVADERPICEATRWWRCRSTAASEEAQNRRRDHAGLSMGRSRTAAAFAKQEIGYLFSGRSFRRLKNNRAVPAQSPPWRTGHTGERKDPTLSVDDVHGRSRWKFDAACGDLRRVPARNSAGFAWWNRRRARRRRVNYNRVDPAGRRSSPREGCKIPTMASCLRSRCCSSASGRPDPLRCCRN